MVKQGSFPGPPGAAPGGPAGALAGKKSVKKNPNVPNRSYALDGEDDKKRTNLGNTGLLMALLSEMWIVHIAIIMGGTIGMSFFFPQYNRYSDDELWNITCYWKLGWLLPMPYTLICFFGLALPFRTPKFLYHDDLKKRRCDNLYILTVTRGNNREAVYRAWNGHKHLERLHPSVRVHVLTDEPFFFENINCYTCPKSFNTARSKYKARALEWYRQTMRYTEHDWVLHLDEESVIDDESVRRCLEFIWYETDYHMGQGVILYNQYQYWKNWIFTVADSLRVGDDLSRFQIQFSYIHRPIFGCHGSFLMNNGLVENSVTWDLGSLTEDYEFAMAAWAQGFRCGKVPGFIREQSPLAFMDFLKQRRRWFVGIWRLHHFLPKLWAFFWTLGIFSLYGTIASVPLGFLVKLDTPRWFGLCKDLTFCTFVYLYILGIFVQDVDKGKNPLLIILHIPMTFVIQYIAVIMEALSVMYGIVFPPKDFDVIKK
ncbi:glycosyl transferase family group 2-domain-containing protein [Cladochytrium replicatum]|nr:glycosyl transferase family group 2-domain-containing protein [Cladochytrium replicatum]